MDVANGSCRIMMYCVSRILLYKPLTDFHVTVQFPFSAINRTSATAPVVRFAVIYQRPGRVPPSSWRENRLLKAGSQIYGSTLLTPIMSSALQATTLCVSGKRGIPAQQKEKARL